MSASSVDVPEGPPPPLPARPPAEYIRLLSPVDEGHSMGFSPFGTSGGGSLKGIENRLGAGVIGESVSDVGRKDTNPFRRSQSGVVTSTVV